jgi:hypothetical protein
MESKKKKFIRPDQVPFVIWVHIGLLSVCHLGRVTVNEAKVSWHISQLTSSIDSAKIKSTLVRLFLHEKVRKDRETCKFGKNWRFI